MNQCNSCCREFRHTTLEKLGGICATCYQKINGISINCSQCKSLTTPQIIEKYGSCHSCLFPRFEKDNITEENVKLKEENERLKARILELRLSPDAGDLYLKSKNNFEDHVNNQQ